MVRSRSQYGIRLRFRRGYGPSDIFLRVMDKQRQRRRCNKTYYGRNYISEVKGDSSNVTFSDNLALFNSGGIQIWDEDSISNTFTNITISGNNFSEMLNADPDQFLASVSSRHKSGLMGGVTYSVVDGSASTGLTISGNTFKGKIGEIYNDNDIDVDIGTGCLTT